VGPADDSERARRLAGASAPAGSRVLDPIAVRTPGGDVESWFVPVVLGGAFVGYVRVGPGGAAYSQFGAPQDVAGWTSPAAVQAAAAASGLVPADDAEPYLGYDGVPARIAWVVPLADGGVAYVAGPSAVWRA
jgi:hypothetical protein